MKYIFYNELDIWNTVSGKKHAVVNAPQFCNIVQGSHSFLLFLLLLILQFVIIIVIGESEQTRDYKNLAVGYELGYVSFWDSINVYAFHLDAYFQTNPAFIPDLLPLFNKPAIFYSLGAGDEESDEEESDEEEEDDEAEYEENDIVENKNFTHWFEVRNIIHNSFA